MKFLPRAHNIALTQRSEPCVQLKVDMKPFAEASEDWEPPTIPAPVTQNCKEQPTVQPVTQVEKQETQTGFQGLIMNQVSCKPIAKSLCCPLSAILACRSKILKNNQNRRPTFFTCLIHVECPIL